MKDLLPRPDVVLDSTLAESGVRARLEGSAAYARQVHDHLTIGVDATRSPTEHPLLNEAETEEMIDCYLLGVSPIAFAARLEYRDILAFEASCT